MDHAFKPLTTLAAVRTELKRGASARRREISLRFFKTGPGEYGEGDRFLGLTVPQVRAVLRRWSPRAKQDLAALARSAWHEERLLAFLAFAEAATRARKAKDGRLQRAIADHYLTLRRGLNNWDLIDTSTPWVLGPLAEGPLRAKLLSFARRGDLWERRIAMLACQDPIREGRFDLTLEVAEILKDDEEDLIHKAVGWMLREAGKRDVSVLRGFLKRHARSLPRTMLRYAIERLPASERKQWMKPGR